MKFLPFPEEIAKETIAATQARWQAFKRRKVRVGDTYTHTRCACYRMPDGALRPVYNPYRPEYPEGAVPGLGTVRSTLKWYPNETTGYEFSVFDFEPLEVTT